MENITYRKPSEDFCVVNFKDMRLEKRLYTTVESMTRHSQSSILSGLGNRNDAKAFYSLLSNDKFSFDKLALAAWKGTAERIKSSGVTEVLLIEDTTDVNLNGHKKTSNLGYCSEHVRGIQTHSCIATTTEGVPLGLLHQQYHTREEPKSTLSAAEKRARPIEERESFRWLKTARAAVSALPQGVAPIIVCDREGDIYELFADTVSIGASFVVRLSKDRVTTDSEHAIQQLRRTKACGEVEIAVPRDTKKGKAARTAKMEVAACSVAVSRTQYSNKELPKSIAVNLVRITEIGNSPEPIEWLLITNLPITTFEECMKIVNIYVQRWKIERFHYVLKSGCRAERIQQRSYEKILPVLLTLSVIAVYILAMTYIAREVPEALCDTFLEEDEWKILYRLARRTKKSPTQPYSLKEAVSYLGELGSYKHSSSDGEYGAKAIWNGLLRLYDALDVVVRLMGQV